MFAQTKRLDGGVLTVRSWVRTEACPVNASNKTASQAENTGSIPVIGSASTSGDADEGRLV